MSSASGLFEPPSALNLAGPITIVIAATVTNSLLGGPDWMLLPILAAGMPLIYWRVRIEARHAAGFR